jgi:hypothetical protein
VSRRGDDEETIMTKALWLLPLAMCVVAIGCESLPGDHARSGAGDRHEDAELAGGDPGASCSEASLDAEGCVCTPGSVPRACLAGGVEKPDLESCTFGTQTCETTTSGEFEASAWGPCAGSVCEGGGGDDNPGDCCAQEMQRCLAAGEPESVCAALDGVCRDQTCDTVTDVCPPTDIPVSAPCARAYQQCFGFLVNKCRRMSFDNCVGQLDDEALCAEWDASCAAREEHCADLLGIPPCDTTSGEGKECEDGEGGNLLYRCTDWGHEFDPCWQPYVDCGVDVPSCRSAFEQCQSNHSMGQTCNDPPTDETSEHGDDTP